VRKLIPCDACSHASRKASRTPVMTRWLDRLELAQLGFHPEVRGIKDSGALFGYYQGMRDAVAHFLLDQNKSASGSLQFSSTHVL
jgi:hypothetical protein